MGERRDAYRVLVGKKRERDRLGYQDAKGVIIIKCNFKKWDEAWTGMIWLRIGTDMATVVNAVVMKTWFI